MSHGHPHGQARTGHAHAGVRTGDARGGHRPTHDADAPAGGARRGREPAPPRRGPSPSPRRSWSRRRSAASLSGSLSLVSDAATCSPTRARSASRSSRRTSRRRPGGRQADLRLPARGGARRPAQRRRAASSSPAGSAGRRSSGSARAATRSTSGSWRSSPRSASPRTSPSSGSSTQEHGLNARSAFLHVLSDTVSSVAILGGAGAMAVRPELWWLDPVLSLAIAALILWGALRLVLEITDILMEAVPEAPRPRRGHAADGDGAAASSPSTTCTSGRSPSGLYALSAHVVVHVGRGRAERRDPHRGEGRRSGARSGSTTRPSRSSRPSTRTSTTSTRH